MAILRRRKNSHEDEQAARLRKLLEKKLGQSAARYGAGIGGGGVSGTGGGARSAPMNFPDYFTRKIKPDSNVVGDPRNRVQRVGKGEDSILYRTFRRPKWASPEQWYPIREAPPNRIGRIGEVIRVVVQEPLMITAGMMWEMGQRGQAMGMWTQDRYTAEGRYKGTTWSEDAAAYMSPQSLAGEDVDPDMKGRSQNLARKVDFTLWVFNGREWVPGFVSRGVQYAGPGSHHASVAKWAHHADPNRGHTEGEVAEPLPFALRPGESVPAYVKAIEDEFLAFAKGQKSRKNPKKKSTKKPKRRSMPQAALIERLTKSGAGGFHSPKKYSKKDRAMGKKMTRRNSGWAHYAQDFRERKVATQRGRLASLFAGFTPKEQAAVQFLADKLKMPRDHVLVEWDYRYGRDYIDLAREHGMRGNPRRNPRDLSSPERVAAAKADAKKLVDRLGIKAARQRARMELDLAFTLQEGDDIKYWQIIQGELSRLSGDGSGVVYSGGGARAFRAGAFKANPFKAPRKKVKARAKAAYRGRSSGLGMAEIDWRAWTSRSRKNPKVRRNHHLRKGDLARHTKTGYIVKVVQTRAPDSYFVRLVQKPDGSRAQSLSAVFVDRGSDLVKIAANPGKRRK